MNELTPIIQKYITPKDSVLDLCCGIGTVMDNIKCRSMVAVDIYRPYIEAYKRKAPFTYFVCEDALECARRNDKNSYDIVTCIDGIEHFTKRKAVQLINHMERVARKKVIIFTTDGFAKNEPKDAWGIKGGDKYQKHICGFKPSYFKRKGYKPTIFNEGTNKYDGTPIRTILYVKKK